MVDNYYELYIYSQFTRKFHNMIIITHNKGGYELFINDKS